MVLLSLTGAGVFWVIAASVAPAISPASDEAAEAHRWVAAGLWPMPTKTPLNVVIHGRIDCDGYTVEKVYFEGAPGFFVTDNLYRPKNIRGCVPGVMFAHGHRENARLYLTPEDTLRKSIADGAERFERAGRNTSQSQCRQLAGMDCVVWQWDMLSDSDRLLCQGMFL